MSLPLISREAPPPATALVLWDRSRILMVGGIFSTNRFGRISTISVLMGPCSLLKGRKAAAPFSISTERIRFSRPMFNSAIMVRLGAAHLQIRHHRLEGT